MPRLLSARLRNESAAERDDYPFSLPVVREMGEMELDAPVTILVGENGSGKSTLIEGIGLAANLPIVGGEPAHQDKTLAPLADFARELRLAWTSRSSNGFLFRAEDFFRFARRMTDLVDEMDDLRKEYGERFKDRPAAAALAMGAAAGQAHAVEARYGRDLHANSHGESFLKFFQTRLVLDGLFLMDEPEASLSPQRQLALLALIRETVNAKNGQFIIATHSPLLMAFPDARIYDLDETPPRWTPWDELEHVTLTRAFLDNPEAFLRRL